MFSGNSGVSLADIAAVTNKENDFGGNWAWIVIILFVLLGNNRFSGNYDETSERCATVGDVQRGFDTNEIINKLNGLENGLCSGFFNQNNTTLNALNDIQKDMFDGFTSVSGSINQARFENQQCCCDTQRSIDRVSYENAKNASDIMMNSNAGVQKILDVLSGNRMADMQNQINQLQLNAALCGVVRYPLSTTYNAGMNPWFNNGGCCGC